MGPRKAIENTRIEAEVLVVEKPIPYSSYWLVDTIPQMGRTDASANDRDSTVLYAVLSVVVFAVLAAIMGYSAVLLGVSRRSALTSILAVGSVFVVWKFLEIVIARFPLPDAVLPLAVGLGLLAFGAWSVLTGRSPILISFAVLVGSWATYDAVRSLRSRKPGITSK